MTITGSLDDFLLLAGSASQELTRAVASHLKIQIGRMNSNRFSDGEHNIDILENVRGKSVFVLQSTGAPANDNLMELLFIVDALRRSSAAEIVAVVPYLGYSRQDRRVYSSRVPISARVVADLLSVAGVNRLLTLDLHADQIQGFYKIPVENIYALPVLSGDMVLAHMNTENSVVVAPDVGAVVRARAYASSMGANLAIIDKRRPRANVAKVMHVIGDVQDKDCFIVDDIVDTANTLCRAAESLKERGANRVMAYCTHAVLSGDAANRVQNSVIDELVISDTIQPDASVSKCDKIRVLTVSQILAETMARVYAHGSISSLF